MSKVRCHRDAVRYEVPAGVLRHTPRYRADCRQHAGAPMVAWAMVPAGQLRITGEPTVYRSSEHGRRHFRGACGTSLFYVDEAVLPGMVDVQTGTPDDPSALPAQAHIQVAERIDWMTTAHGLPVFERYPT